MHASASNVQEARRAFGRRLREIREESGLTARELAGLAGWHESKCSKIEHGKVRPSFDDIRAYTELCDGAGARSLITKAIDALG